jgi:hypothetical protein
MFQLAMYRLDKRDNGMEQPGLSIGDYTSGERTAALQRRSHARP